MELSVFQIAGLVFLFVLLALVIAGAAFYSMWDSRELGYLCMLQDKDERIVKLKQTLRESLEYLESGDGRRGKLCGCAVNRHAYDKWIKLLED